MSSKKGRAWVFDDNVDTDLIYHNKYLAESDPKNMPQYAFEYYPGKENFAKEVKPGDFVVAGKNFGCGSSREHAVYWNMPVSPVSWQKPVPGSTIGTLSTMDTRSCSSKGCPMPSIKGKSRMGICSPSIWKTGLSGMKPMEKNSGETQSVTWKKKS